MTKKKKKTFFNQIISFFSQKQLKEASDFLANEMGQMVNRASRDKIPINLTKEEINQYIKRFQIMDKERKGYVSINDIRRGLKVMFYIGGGLRMWSPSYRVLRGGHLIQILPFRERTTIRSG
jgi:hypothetical protein